VNASMKPRGYFSSLFAKGTRAPADPTSPHFRPDIQGMRAIAVGIVVLDHAHIPGLSGGFIGVDVFFVLSGFLITGLLLGDVAKTGGVRFLNFYARRAARILPAATLVIVATLAASYIVLNVIQARSVAGDGLWSVFFLANYHFAAVGTNYFAAVTATSPLQHFWSLAVEEQFYLVWPFLLGTVAFLTHRRRATTSYHVPRRSLYALLIPITAYSLYLSITQTSANPTAAYFSTFDRTWELGIGALLALTLPHLSRIPGLARAALSWAGLAGVLLAATTFSSHTRIPGYLALVPVLGAAAMVAGGVGRPRYGASSLLAVRPLRFIGDISYSLYLWHWPVLILGAAAHRIPRSLSSLLLRLRKPRPPRQVTAKENLARHGTLARRTRRRRYHRPRVCPPGALCRRHSTGHLTDLRPRNRIPGRHRSRHLRPVWRRRTARHYPKPASSRLCLRKPRKLQRLPPPHLKDL
jgi:peptidoglycan/LPS O-acetylase OafA/YrhL